MTAIGSPRNSDARSPALDLAEWILANTPDRPDTLTHLKLQKLEFYCYGALLALDLDRELGNISFEAWKRGPVAPEVYERYSAYSGEPVPKPTRPLKAFSPRVESALSDVVNVYGRMTAWQLREESHWETPWTRNDGTSHPPLCTEDLREHFRKKLLGPAIPFPERLFGGSSMLLDRVPVPTFSSLAEMSRAASRILGNAG